MTKTIAKGSTKQGDQENENSNADDLPKIFHLQSFVNAQTDLLSLIESSPNIPPQLINDDTKFCLVGLHCCGDLTPTLMRIFCANPRVRCLCVVGCCYYSMREGRRCLHDHDEGLDTHKKSLENFPMSDFVRTIGDDVLSDGSLKVACDNGEERGSDDSIILPGTDCSFPERDMNALYRLVLDKLLWEGLPGTSSVTPCSCGVTVRKIRLKKIMGFAEYTKKALSRVKIKQVWSITLRFSYYLG